MAMTTPPSLQDCHVLVVGMGGLGCPAALVLVDAGVGRLTLMDDDRVTMSNLHRQVLYTDRDVGQLKVKVARDVLSRRRPGVEIVARHERLVAATAVEMVGGFDLVLDCTDGFRSKYLINDACMIAAVPFVHAGVIAWQGQALAVPRGGPCLRCILAAPPSPSSGGEASTREGVVGPLVGCLAALEAKLALDLLAGRGRPGELIVVDGLAGTGRRLSFPRASACPSCGQAADRGLHAEDYPPVARAAAPEQTERPGEPHDSERYARQMLAPGWGATGQARLSGSHIAIHGRGRAAEAAAVYLAAAGVGSLAAEGFLDEMAARHPRAQLALLVAVARDAAPVALDVDDSCLIGAGDDMVTGAALALEAVKSILGLPHRANVGEQGLNFPRRREY